MLLGSDGPGGIEFDDAHLTREAGTVGLGLILYEGGLQTSWRRLRSVVFPAALLSTVGVVVCACVTGVVAYGLFDLTWLEAFLLGAVVASTDAAAVFSTLRFTHISRRLARTLEAESGGNDPMAIALTLGLIAWIEHPQSHGFGDLAVLVARQISIGLVAGVTLGAVAAWGCLLGSRSWSSAPSPRWCGSGRPRSRSGSQTPSVGAGFLPFELVGLAVGSTPSRYRQQLAAFHEGLAFVAQVGLFVLLGLLVFPHELPDVALPGVALAVALMLVARPAAVWVSTALSDYSTRDRVLLGWAGLRGAAPIVVATFVLESHVRHEEFDLQHRLLRRRRVGTRPGHNAGTCRTPARADLPRAAPARARRRGGTTSPLDLVEFSVASNHAINGSAVRELGLPRDTLVAVIQRDGHAIPPRGSTPVQANDRLFVLAPHDRRPDLEDVFARWRRLI